MDAEILQNKIIDSKDIKIIRQKNSSRKVDPSLEEAAKTEWETILKKAHADGMNPWDGIVYRLDNLDEVKNGSIEFKLSTVRYSQLRAFQKLKVSENYPPEYHTLHMGTLGIVKTSDGFYVFGFREKSLNSSQVTFIGGALQEDELDVLSGDDIKQNMYKELKEETNISPEEVGNIKIIKIIRAIERMNIFILFSLDLNLTKDEVQEHYESIEDKEHDKLVFVTRVELAKYAKDLPDFMKLSLQHITES